MEKLFSEFKVETKKLISEHELFRIDNDVWHNCDHDQYVWYDDLTKDKIVMQQIYKKIISTQTKFYCPLCDTYNIESEYLSTVFKDTKTKWLANMITHFRHSHTDTWDKTWGAGGYGYEYLSQVTYSIEKEKMNNLAKRQIIMKATNYLLHNNITAIHFKALNGTDKKTLQLAGEKLKTQQEVQ